MEASIHGVNTVHGTVHGSLSTWCQYCTVYMVQYMEASIHGVNTVHGTVQYMEASIHGVNTVQHMVQYMEASIHGVNTVHGTVLYSTWKPQYISAGNLCKTLFTPPFSFFSSPSNLNFSRVHMKMPLGEPCSFFSPDPSSFIWPENSCISNK